MSKRTEQIKVLHVSASDSSGGAARAAYRIHLGLHDAGVDSHMRVLRSDTAHEGVTFGEPRPSLGLRLARRAEARWTAYRQQDWWTDNPIIHTFGQVSAGLLDELNASDADILHLHWISRMLSISDIGKLKKPLVWTLHDMWAFCGGEHLVPDKPDARFRMGYLPDNRPAGERGPDLNRRTWELKRKAWAQQQFTVVCPSRWLAECARGSVLLAKSDVVVIPNPLETETIWHSTAKDVARAALGLPLDGKLVVTGAAGGLGQPHKGGDLLKEALSRVVQRSADPAITLAIFGQAGPDDGEPWPCPVVWLGRVRDDRLLALIYSAADVVVVPSREDTLPQTATEAQACAVPVAAFDVGGLPDIISHMETGWLAAPFDTADLAEGISWILASPDNWDRLSAASRDSAVRKFSLNVVARQYAALYGQVLDRRGAK